MCPFFCIKQQGSSSKNTEDFISEASIMGQFRHPNVILLVGVVTISTYSVHVFITLFSFYCCFCFLFTCFFSFNRFTCVVNT